MKACKTCNVEYLPRYLCEACKNCLTHCTCQQTLFDADELGLDPETDNTPAARSRNA